MQSLLERVSIPDRLVRFGVRRRLRRFLDERRALAEHEGGETLARFVAEMRGAPIAIETDAANRQHYEVPAEFYEAVLGRWKKYSCCLWEGTAATLDDAEEAMLALSGERAGIRDGQRILDLGCGWGSFSLWAARRWPRCRVVALSNSRSQRESIEKDAARLGLTNVRVLTGDVAAFDTDERFDRIVSIEMLEHVRNHEALFSRLSRWLAEDGALFAHVFCHRSMAYTFGAAEDDWFGSRFFTGGMMPSWDYLPRVAGPLELVERWRVPGTHYARTLRAWLGRLDAHRHAALAALAEAADSPADAKRALRAFRLFFLASEEAFGFDGGGEWQVGHYLFRHSGSRATP